MIYLSNCNATINNCYSIVAIFFSAQVYIYVVQCANHGSSLLSYLLLTIVAVFLKLLSSLFYCSYYLYCSLLSSIQLLLLLLSSITGSALFLFWQAIASLFLILASSSYSLFYFGKQELLSCTALFSLLYYYFYYFCYFYSSLLSFAYDEIV